MKIKNSITTRQVNFEEDGIVLTLIGDNITDCEGFRPQDENSYFWSLLKNKEYYKYLFLNELADGEGLHQTLSEYFFTILQKSGLCRAGDTIFAPQRIVLEKFIPTHTAQNAH